jgi:hypothetical protein
MTPLDRPRGARGQALTIMVLAMTTLLLAVAVTIDGGNAFQQQRAVQNGSDGAALAGAVELGNYAACNLWSCPTPTDTDVRGAIDAAAAANAIDVPAAYYTDVCGTPLKPDGTAARSGNSVNLALAAEVGDGVIPPHAGGSPNCVTGEVGPTAGVLVFGHRSAPTFIAGMIGINTFEIETQATAVATYGTCASSQGCALLPIAFPVNVTTCDGNKEAVDAGLGPWQLNVVYKIPLCKKNPGNVGWLDWDPKGGGTQDVVSAIERPDNSPITFPSWQFVSEPGNKQSNQLEDALRALEGETVRIVQFDHMCGDDQPDSSQPIIDDPARWYGCTQAQFEQGNGSNLWYRLPRMLGFVMCDPGITECFIDGVAMHDAYMGGGQGDPECESAGNGAVACIVGKFVDLGNAGFGGSGDSSPVQLIR